MSSSFLKQVFVAPFFACFTTNSGKHIFHRKEIKKRSIESSLILTGNRGCRNPLRMKVLAERGNERAHQFSFFLFRTRWWIIWEMPRFFSSLVGFANTDTTVANARLRRLAVGICALVSSPFGPFEQNKMLSIAVSGETQVSRCGDADEGITLSWANRWKAYLSYCRSTNTIK